MKLAAAFGDARQTRRIHRAQAAVVARYQSTLPSPRARLRDRLGASVMRIGLPLLVPLFTWLGRTMETPLLHLVAALLALGIGVLSFQLWLLRFQSDEVLRYPSKAGVLLCRLQAALPGQLFVGACHAGALALAVGDALWDRPAPAAALLVTAVLAPVCWNLGRVYGRLKGTESTLGPLVFIALCGGVVAHVATDPGRTWGSVAFAGIVGVAGGAGLVASLVSWVRAPRRSLQGLAGDLGLLPRWAVVGALAAPFAVDLATVLEPAVWILVPLAALWPWFLLARGMHAVQDAEENTPGSVARLAEDEPPRAPRPARPSALPTHHRGRPSALRAALYLHRKGSLLFDPAAWLESPGPLFSVVFHLWGVLLACLAVATSAEGTGKTVLAVLCGLTAPAFVTSRPDPGLYLLGVDYRVQALVNLRAWLWFAVLPVLCTAIATGTVLGWTAPRVVVSAWIAASLAVRLGWRGLVRTNELEPDPRALLAGLALLVSVTFWPPPPGPAVAWILGVATLAGGIGLALRVHGSAEERLAAAVRQAEEERP